MTDYPEPDKAEGPDEINPEWLVPAEEVRIQLLLKHPESYRTDDDGKVLEDSLEVDPKWLNWSGVPLVRHSENCGHTFSVCSECADTWGIDYFMRIFYHEELTWMSPDHPDNPFGGEAGDQPPIWHI